MQKKARRESKQSKSSSQEYKKMTMSGMSTSRTGSGTKKYKICRLVPYENEELGAGNNNIRKTTTILNEYFLVESK